VDIYAEGLLSSLFNPIATPLDLDHIPMFDKPFGDGGGDGVVLKNLSPVFEGLVGGQDDRTGIGTLRYDLEEEVPSVFIQRHV
jgi:hypothetical protein